MAFPCCVVLTLMLVVSPTSAPTSRTVCAAGLQTEHYDLYVEQLDPAEIGRLLECLYADLKSFFGASPAGGIGRLKLRIYADRDRWADALRRDGHAVPKGGGYYSPANRTAYLYSQPSEYFTRHLLLHEATHQFHWLSATGDKSPSAEWYCEGLAEYFAMHNWEPGRPALKTGVVPAVSLEDYPARALREFDDARLDLQGIVVGRVACGRSLAWAIVHYLKNKHEAKFRDLARRLDSGQPAATAWKEIFGPVRPAMVNELRAYIQQLAQPWQIVWISWQERGELIEGSSAANALMLRKKTPATLSAELSPAAGQPFKAGLAFAYRDEGDFRLFQATPDGQWRVVQRNAGQWKVLGKGPLPPAGKSPTTLAVRQDEQSSVLLANGKEVAKYDATGMIGLNVDACTVRFRVIECSGDYAGSERQQAETPTGAAGGRGLQIIRVPAEK